MQKQLQNFILHNFKSNFPNICLLTFDSYEPKLESKYLLYLACRLDCVGAAGALILADQLGTHTLVWNHLSNHCKHNDQISQFLLNPLPQNAAFGHAKDI